ncbi:DUF692 domain-containing protein [Legionella israelensis]|uniref:DUF692 domain-containing protein n=1 Tax=Legionella israelensis TaxID=454 RepID=A0A0W0VU11_9GAMM|nr:DUF692 domain-containing protein [Legionella israelensis]KTD23659.1 hypothetical protein Lisr_1340 [Legionella israelensis]QBS10957.1 DUF692 domain-containing protein [Legionella israelensis]SCX79302.1 Uncharacterized conserved protein, UPF0276 family [Legionella israelensis DSM 19235]STX57949.1 Protein of uncharacterised function (DUF692) [Legionella israelensis]
MASFIRDSSQTARFSGCTGIGLRSEHVGNILKQRPKIDYFEVLADNYLQQSNTHFNQLLKIAECYPLSLHSVGLSIATSSKPDMQYLQQLKELANRLDCTLLSDHLCWTHAKGHYTHELMPFPYTEDTLAFIVEKIHFVQDFLQQPVMFENVSRYISYKQNTLTEAEFLNELCKQTGCGILLDINNLYVNHYNHNDDIHLYFSSLDSKNVWQMHLGGFSKQQGYLLDSHSDRIYQEVWTFFEKAQILFPKTPTIIEWDNQLPEFSVLYEEMQKAKKIMEHISANRSVQHAQSSA